MLSTALFLTILPLLAAAQDGGITGPTTSAEAAGYSCDPNSCKLPSCNCASTSPPGGLRPEEVPQFIVFTADDAIQSYTIDSVNQFLAQRKNPNGCRPKMTYFASLGYTNYTLVTDWYVAGNEIADHTMTHVGTPSKEEINGNLIALNALAGIPLSAIQGFRAPFLNWTSDTLKLLADSRFTYDSSATSSIPVDHSGTDAYWPYTLDHGLANDCLRQRGVCKGEPKIPGFWEIPMYAFFDNAGISGPHLMDPWLDVPSGSTKVNNTATLDYMKNTFTAHYQGNRQPIGLYTHPIHTATNYPGVSVPRGLVEMINEFLDWAQEQDNVWIISNEQLLEWMKNPVSISRLEEINALKCSTPQVDEKICNGMPENQAGLLSHCTFPESPFYTCYGCPSQIPSPSNPNPPQQSDVQPRFRLPGNCSTPFWDPIDGKCVCDSADCVFVDQSRPIGPNGANLTGGGTGSSSGSTSSSKPTPYTPFNGSGAMPSLGLPAGFWAAVIIGWAGALAGAFGIAARL